VSSYILVRLRLACVDWEHALAVRDPQVSCWNEVEISTGYKNDKGMKANLGFNSLQNAE
jgi:hypothetical protein